MQQILTGSGVRLIINGKVIGFATGLSFNRSQATKVFYEIDSPVAVEIAPLLVSVSGNLTGIRLRDDFLDTRRAMSLGDLNDFFDQKYINIEVVDRLTNKTLYHFRDAMFDSDSWSINAKSVITFSASFKAKWVSNETSST